MSAADPVQTPQEATPQGSAGLRTAVCLRAPRSGKLRVVWASSDEHHQLLAGGWEVEEDVCFGQQACACGCGLPVPFSRSQKTAVWPSGEQPHVPPLQRYADPEGCRKAAWALQHPQLDLSGMQPLEAKRAARMAEEAVRAAKMGQSRATVDADARVVHDPESPRGPETRPSNRVRLSPEAWALLGEMKELGYHAGRSYSAIVMDLIEREVEDLRLRAQQEGENE